MTDNRKVIIQEPPEYWLWRGAQDASVRQGVLLALCLLLLFVVSAVVILSAH